MVAFAEGLDWTGAPARRITTKVVVAESAFRTSFIYVALQRCREKQDLSADCIPLGEDAIIL